jgi:mannitol/fructose-specific phosphotransferase system IIA component (Ntr-type)
MHLADLIGPEAVIASLKVKNKKQLLQELSARAARFTGLQERYIFDTLLQPSVSAPPGSAKASPSRMASLPG